MTIEDYLKNNWDGTDASIDLVAEVVEPEGTKEELAKVKDLLGSYTTNYSTSSAGRCANISVAKRQDQWNRIISGRGVLRWTDDRTIDGSGRL